VYVEGLPEPKSTGELPARGVHSVGATSRRPPGRAHPGVVLLGPLLILLATAGATSVGPSSGADRATGQWPLAGAVSVVRGFDAPEQPWSAAHRGADLRSTEGATVRAAVHGTVTFAGIVAGRGVVVVDHGDGTRTTYEPVLASVRAGQPVAAGAELGTLAGAASHCLPATCLHWGWRRGEVYLDPVLLVGRGGPVRLLPVWAVSPAPALPRPSGFPVAADTATEAAADPAARSGRSRRWQLAAVGTGGWAWAAAVGVAALRCRRGQSSEGRSRASRL
jgi:hypothetical protein